MEAVLAHPSLRELSHAELADIDGGGVPEPIVKAGRWLLNYTKDCLVNHAKEFIDCAIEGYKEA